MQTNVFLWIILAAVVSMALALFQYYFKNTNKKKYHILLATLRFFSIFCGLLLLINPKLTKNELSIEKAKLLLLVDNSTSMLQNSSSDSLLTKIEKIQGDDRINERFDISTTTFGSDFSNIDSIAFNQNATNISLALEKSSELFSSENTSVVLLTDGNQTTGKDYEFVQLPNAYQVWPIVVGDTAKYQDLSVSQVNLNKYAFLDNQFPLESVIAYQGQNEISTQLQIFFDGTRVYSEQLRFQNGEKSKTISTLLTATSVGVKSVTISLSPLEAEKNVANNRKETAIEVVDEKTKVLLVTDMVHPDIGTFKKTIETNKQRNVKIVGPDVDLAQHENADILIAYQPKASYQTVYDFAKARNIPILSVVGTQANLSWISNRFDFLEIELGYPVQETFGGINGSFPHFNVAEFDFEGFPPLATKIGAVDFKALHDGLLDMTIKGVQLESPLMTIVPNQEAKHVFLFGDNIWKWRLHNFRESGNFSMFDNLFGKLMVYLSKSGKRNRLEIEYQKVYDGSQDFMIRANFYDKTFVQDNQADLTIQLRGKDNSFSRNVPMLFKGNYFEVDISDLPGGEYDFSITENNENISRLSSFKILDFDPEEQFLTANHEKLERLAAKSNGKIFFENQLDELIENLVQEERFVPVQKNNQKIVPLIDFRWLLALLAITLSAEWFIRKYNGLL